MKQFYLYVLLDPRCTGSFQYADICFLFKPFYVGKGSGDRWQIHLRESCLQRDSNEKKVNLIRKLRKDYNLRRYVVIIPCVSETDALQRERAMIAGIGRDNLVNLNDGGSGSSGFKHSPEFCRMIRERNSRPKPDGHGQAVSATKTGVPFTHAHKQALRGPKSAAHCENLRTAALKRWAKAKMGVDKRSLGIDNNLYVNQDQSSDTAADQPYQADSGDGEQPK